jgi:hypothetical protein
MTCVLAEQRILIRVNNDAKRSKHAYLASPRQRPVNPLRRVGLTGIMANSTILTPCVVNHPC